MIESGSQPPIHPDNESEQRLVDAVAKPQDSHNRLIAASRLIGRVFKPRVASTKPFEPVDTINGYPISQLEEDS